MTIIGKATTSSSTDLALWAWQPALSFWKPRMTWRDAAIALSIQDFRRNVAPCTAVPVLAWLKGEYGRLTLLRRKHLHAIAEHLGVVCYPLCILVKIWSIPV